MNPGKGVYGVQKLVALGNSKLKYFIASYILAYGSQRVRSCILFHCFYIFRHSNSGQKPNTVVWRHDIKHATHLKYTKRL